MDFDTFREEMESYLPIDFYDEENNRYKNYLLEALEENYQNEKYQFCILAINMLFMSYLYKSFWFLLDKDIAKVKNMLRVNQKLNVVNMFHLSPIREQEFIDQYLSVFDFSINRKNEAKNLINIRDCCAHASGEIQYGLEDMPSVFQEYLKQIKLVFDKHKESLREAFLKNYQSFFSEIKSTYSFFNDWCQKEKVSVKELLSIFEKVNEMEQDPEDIDADLKETSILLLKYYIGIKTGFQVSYTADMFRKDLELLLKKHSGKYAIIVTYLQNECNYNYEILDQDLMDEIINMNAVPEKPKTDIDDISYSGRNDQFDKLSGDKQ